MPLNTETSKCINVGEQIELSNLWPAVECVHHFQGASRKRAPFRGWAGLVTAWPEKSAPTVAFGQWRPDVHSEYGGGSVRFVVPPFTLLMWGANSTEMRSKDKTTNFGFAGLSTEGRLRIAALPQGSDARDVFARGGWHPPDIKGIVKKMEFLIAGGTQTPSELSSGMDAVRAEVCLGFGIAPLELKAVLQSWTQLSCLECALSQAEQQLAQMRANAKAVRLAKTVFEVKSVIQELEALGQDLTQLSISTRLVPAGSSPHQIKEKARNIKKALEGETLDLGDEWIRAIFTN